MGDEEHTNVFVYGQDSLTRTMEAVREGLKERQAFTPRISTIDLSY